MTKNQANKIATRAAMEKAKEFLSVENKLWDRAEKQRTRFLKIHVLPDIEQAAKEGKFHTSWVWGSMDSYSTAEACLLEQDLKYLGYKIKQAYNVSGFCMTIEWR